MIQDIRFAWRALRKSPGFAIAAICTLALGIGANTAIFSIVRAVLLRSLPYPNADHIVSLWERNPRQGFDQELVTPGDFADWRARAHVFEDMAFSPAWPGARFVKLIGNDGAERVPAAYVSASYFSVLGVTPALGRTFLAEEDQKGGAPVAILSHSLWTDRFAGRSDILGAEIAVNSYGAHRFQVVGVMPGGFRFPGQTDIWLPAGQMGVGVPAAGSSSRGGPWLEVIARLKPGVTVDRASSEMNSIAADLAQRFPGRRIGSEVKVVRLQDQIVGSMRAGLFALLGAVSCVLLIASVNVASLLLARATSRRREIAICAALGAGALPLIRRILAETMLLSFSGGLAGVLCSSWGIAALVTTVGDRIPRLSEATVDWAVLCYTATICLITGTMFGFVPAIRATQADLSETLDNSRSGKLGTRGRTLSSGLVVAEVALACVLLVGAGLFVRSLISLQSVDPGFRPERVLAVGIDMSGGGSGARSQMFFAELQNHVRSLPGVESAGGTSLLPLQGGGWQDRPGGGWNNQGFVIERQPRSAEPSVRTADPRVVTAGYFETMGIPLRAGRLFSASDSASAPHVVIINETMARRYWAGSNPVGDRISFSDERHEPPAWMEIVGVVGDTRTAGLDAPPRPEFMLPFDQSVWSEADLVVRTTGDPAGLANTIRRQIRALNPNASITHVHTMDQVMSDSILQPRLRTGLLIAFSMLALILAAVGLYGVLTYSVAQRQQEIGVRMALGATREDILRLVLGRGLQATTLGIALGCAAALATTRLLRSLLFGVGAFDLLSFTGAALLLLAVALVSSYLPARRAMNIDPAVAFRAE